jgi:hypothetical protein
MSQVAAVDDAIRLLISQPLIDLIEYCSILSMILIVADMGVRYVCYPQKTPVDKATLHSVII